MPSRATAIAWDFDGVLSEDTGVWRGSGIVGRPIPACIEAARAAAERGFVNILWSCRGDTGTLEEFCSRHGIPIDYLNQNPFWERHRGDNPHKIKADVSIDDKGLNPFVQRVGHAEYRILRPEEIDPADLMAAIEAVLRLRKLKVDGEYYEQHD